MPLEIKVLLHLMNSLHRVSLAGTARCLGNAPGGLAQRDHVGHAPPTPFLKPWLSLRLSLLRPDFPCQGRGSSTKLGPLRGLSMLLLKMRKVERQGGVGDVLQVFALKTPGL